MNTKLLIDRYRRNSLYSLSILSIIAIDIIRTTMELPPIESRVWIYD